MKEKEEASYKASENPQLLYSFLEFVIDLGLKPAILNKILDTIGKIHYLLIDRESEPRLYYNRQR